ncbi:hypothetical protein C4B38_000290 [Diabrotica virgifera virgifera]|nr:hypothetical protein C4B38_000290 [Diabrotica virgifera virgifera]
MGEIFSSYTRLTTVIPAKYNWAAFDVLLLMTICTCLIWFLQLIWSRRRLYKCSMEMPGPPGLPIFGSFMLFMGDSYEIFQNISKLFETYPGVFRVWLGPRLFYAVSDPKYFEILFTKCLAKERLNYKADFVVGKGLFTAERKYEITLILRFEIMEIVFLRIFVLWYQNDFIFNLSPLGKESRNIVKGMRDFTGRVVREKKKAYEERKNCSDNDEVPLKRKAFLDYLMEVTNDENVAFTDQELQDEVTTFIIAGSDTSASTSCYAFIMLGLHPHLQDKVFDEIMEVVGPDGRIEGSDLPKLKFLERFIKETLRLFPVGGILARAVDEDIDLGLQYAMMAMKTLIATVVRKFRISTSYQRVEDIKLKAHLVLRPKDGFKVSMQRRA